MEKNKMVTITYVLRIGDKNGQVVDVSSKEKPLTFPFGAGMLLPAFENAIADKQIGDSFEIEILSNDGYGHVNNEMVVNIPINAFLIEGKIDSEILKVGNVLPMMSGDGNVMNGNVRSIESDYVIMDFNHPLAGNDLYFTGEIINISEATDEKLKQFCDDDCDDESCDGCSE